MAAPGGLQLPAGFRFHPTGGELVVHYLKPKVDGHCHVHPDIVDIPVVDMYKCEPSELPGKSFMPSREQAVCYLFAPRERKYPNGSRVNRATPRGHWKSTGKDRRVLHGGAVVGMRKTLVYYEGRAPAPRGARTDWVMYEYRLHDDAMAAATQQLSSYVLCQLRNKKANYTQPSGGEGIPDTGNVDDWLIWAEDQLDTFDYSWMDC